MSSVIGYSNLPIDSVLTSVLSELAKRPKAEQAKMMAELLRGPKSERDKDAARKRVERADSARIVIPECKNPARREACLDDPERFLSIYFPEKYKLGFGRDHRFMIDSFVRCAQDRTWQAVLAPRGRGKSEIFKGIQVYVVFKGLVRFPLAVAATTDLAKRLYDDFKRKLATNDLLLDDFPEICYPIRALEGAPQRAARQHIDGQLTNIVWTGDYIRLPDVPGSPYGGVKMTYYGLDAAFRGANIDGDRPDFVGIDDPETRESARSLHQIGERKSILLNDIVGLKSQESNIAIIVLSTAQNRYCLSFQLADVKQMPAFNGERFGRIVKWPTNMELWEQYIALRHADGEARDKLFTRSLEFYKANREELHAGSEMITEHYVEVEVDGVQLVDSSLQEAFNQIADTDLDSYKTEYQNDPPAEEEIESLKLTASKVQSRVWKHRQGQRPTSTQVSTIGIDIGHRQSHWIDLAWEGNAIGSVVDYGIMETYQQNAADDKAVELAILASLESWADEVVAKVNPLLVLVDSGNGKAHTQAVYEFCRRRGAPFFPSKGWDANRFRLPNTSETKRPFLETWAHFLEEDRVWLYNVNTEWWKRWVQQRFVTNPYNDDLTRADGSIVLFDPLDDRKRHLAIAHHITSEEEQLVPVFGKESKRVWFQRSKNNHWLDAIALASAAAGAVGIRLVEAPKPVVLVEEKKPEVKPFLDPYGRPFVALGRR